jgi:hypothetical protein
MTNPLRRIRLIALLVVFAVLALSQTACTGAITGSERASEENVGDKTGDHEASLPLLDAGSDALPQVPGDSVVLDGSSGNEDSAPLDASSDARPQVQDNWEEVCAKLRGDKVCTVASFACADIASLAPLSARECGTSIADGKLNETAVDCMVKAVDNQQPFLLVGGFGPMLEGEFWESAWLGYQREGKYEIVQYATAGGGCCPPLPRTLTRTMCSSISVRNKTTPRCEEVTGSLKEVCACSDTLWFYPYYTCPGSR